ncbi:MAG TPA: hypothetical protein VMX57_00485, partial [Planctomycetota bacterium]|nr:hypothetical protein [Planctomycetota bacterium]
VRFSDNYSHGGKYRFARNTFTKVGSDTRYRTIVMGYRGYRYPSFGHAFFDTTFEGGASFDRVSFEGARDTQFDFSVGYTLDITGAPGTMVRISDRTGENVFSGAIAADAKLAVPLLAWRRNAEGRTMLTPHTVNAGGREVKVTIDRARTLNLAP